MRTYFKTVLGAFAAFFLSGSGASAATMVATITGTTSDYYFGSDNGYDTTGEFGLSDLGGTTFTATFTYNTSVGVRTTTPGADELTNSAAFPDVVSATITINGVTETIAGNNTEYGFGDEAFIFPFRRAQFNSTDDFTVNDINTDSSLFFEPAADTPASLTDTMTTMTTSNPTTNTLDISVYDDNTNQYLHHAEVFLNASTLTISAAVPEPATWAMFLVGFGAVGFAMRRPLGKVVVPFA